MLSFAPKYSLLPLSAVFFTISAILFSLYQFQLTPFTGTNTLIFSASSLVLFASLTSDYILTSEMIYTQTKPSEHPNAKKFSFTRNLLGLDNGTDRLFKFSALFVGISISSFLGLLNQAIANKLGTVEAQTFGFLGCSTLILSATIYQTASKVTSYKSLVKK